MPDTNSSKKGSAGKTGMNISFKKQKEKPASHEGYSSIPLSFYWAKDMVRGFISNPNFPDAFAIAFAIFSVAIVFPFFPVIILIPLIAVAFLVTLYSPLAGLMIMLFETLMMFVYQTPLLAWMLTIFVSICLFLGYKHYRSITFIYVLMMLPFSSLGYALELPAFIIGILYIGFRRSLIATVIVLLFIVILSGVTGIPNSAPITYNSTSGNAALAGIPGSSFFVPSSNITTVSTFFPSFSAAILGMFSAPVAGNIFNGAHIMATALANGIVVTLIQVLLWLLVVFAMISYVIKSRSPFKGTHASLFSFVIIVAYFMLGYSANNSPSSLVIIGFLLTPITLFVLELNGVEVVKSLQVMKQDFLGKFGEAFQDLTAGTAETLDDVANYDETKKELREAILAPIEHREITGAYNVKPTKGILLFGPPGTGKTLIMRAISNEIRAKFFYVKTSSIISPFQGESAQTLSKIFATARKNTPAVLFFDEIDGIAAKRESQDSDNNRQLLSTLLSEMDGFEKIEGVVIVGSTNAPQLIDPGVLRPGRMDKAIYMPLPDKLGRAKIFEHYLKKLPVGPGVSYPKLAEMAARYTGADIKNVSDEVARRVADEAVKQHKMLQIDMDDITKVIKNTKPSTSLASIDKYNQFKLDYERRAYPETIDQKENAIKIDDVIGLDQAKKALYEAVELPILHSSLVKKYDVHNINGILLFGPPGTGKTMLMRAVASEMEDVTLISVSGSDLVKNGLENALTEVRETFNRARENIPCIMFIDEIDAILPSRESSSEFTTQITSEFLQQLDGLKGSSGIVFVGATNRPDKLDSAILRPGRMDRFVFVGPPSLADRKRLFEVNLSKCPVRPDIDFDKIASLTEGYTGADIANICRQAKLNALEESITTAEDKKVGTSDLTDLIGSTRPSAPSSVLGSYMNFISLYGGR